MNRLNDAAAFWARVNRDGDCWQWTASRLKAGYGRFRWQRRQRLAHQVAWIISHGEIPYGLSVLHRCDNPPCVNPGHLFLGTKAENNADRNRKGRSASGDRNGSRTKPERLVRGADNHKSILTETQVTEARLRHAVGESCASLAREYGVSTTVMHRAITGRTWRHVGGEVIL